MNRAAPRQPSSSLHFQPWAINQLAARHDGLSGPDFRDMIEVSDALLAGYARLARKGIPAEMIGAAMLSASLNLYDMFELSGELPDLLRDLAERVESTRPS